MHQPEPRQNQPAKLNHCAREFRFSTGNGNARAFFAFTLCAVGVCLAIVSLAATASVSMAVLVGDASASKIVSNSDVAAVKAQVATLVTSSNFRQDVNANGII